MIAVTLLLYGIFKPVSRGLSLLAASFNLVGLTFGALRWNPRGVDIPVVFDGFYCLVIGYLIFQVGLSASNSWRADSVCRFRLAHLSMATAHTLSVPLQCGRRHPRARSGNAVAPHDGRKRTTMEGAGQSSGRVTNHSK
jgi:hypothetical protein